MPVKILFGFDTERPFGESADTEDGRVKREENLELIDELNRVMDEHGAERTFFILGDYLERGAAQLGENHLRQVFQPLNPLVEIGQHTYSHITVAPIATRPDRKPARISELTEDLSKADESIRRVLGVESIFGLRTPLGYAHRALENFPEVIAAFKKIGLNYVSSSLRSADWGINAPLQESRLRQPFTYENGLIEIPAHGWQDTAFTGTSRTKGMAEYPTTTQSILEHYVGLFEQSIEINRTTGKPILVGLCMHPWAMRQYDPDLKIIGSILDWAGKKNIECAGYGKEANQF